MRLFILTILSLMIVPFSAFAQDVETETDNEYDDVRYEYLEEAQQFYERCQTDYDLYQYYDCECLSVKYLDKRIEFGPDKTENSILLSIRRTCQDATIAAGEHYKSCVTNGTILPKGQSMEEYCGCFANTYAKLFEEYGAAPSSKTFTTLQTKAHTACRKRKNNYRITP